jgi:hypothetical protein
VRILALEVEAADAPAEAFGPLARAEAVALWDLVQAGFVRETYFRSDRAEAVLVLECGDLDEARGRLASLAFVRAGLIRFELIGLRPYPGFARLFEPGPEEATGQVQALGHPADPTPLPASADMSTIAERRDAGS